MVFRCNEAKMTGTEKAIRYLTPRGTNNDMRNRIEQKIREIVETYGPVVEHYPGWHPLVENGSETNIVPNERSGYGGLDHCVYFVNAFITCPYNDGQKVFDSVERLQSNSNAEIQAKALDVKMYNHGATPILVTCKWNRELGEDNMIPASIALPLMLKKVLSFWESAQIAESWFDMRSYILGSPCGKRSSLFVNQKTGLILKKAHEMLMDSGAFGPYANV